MKRNHLEGIMACNSIPFQSMKEVVSEGVHVVESSPLVGMKDGAHVQKHKVRGSRPCNVNI